MSDQRDPATDQPLSVPGKQDVFQVALSELDDWGDLSDEIRDLVRKGLEQRRLLGISKYGRPLETHNGRDALKDAWQECLDLFVYLYQADLESPLDGAIIRRALGFLETIGSWLLARGPLPDPDPTYSLWSPEESVVYSSEASGVVGQEECRAWFTNTYAQQLGKTAVIAPRGMSWDVKMKVMTKVGSALTAEQAAEKAAGYPSATITREGSPEESDFQAQHDHAVMKRD